MLIYLTKRKAQSTLEYAVLIGILVAGLIAMQAYIKRGYQGKLRESADKMGNQFSPERTTYKYHTVSMTNASESTNAGATNQEIINSYTNRTGNESVEGVVNEEMFNGQ